MVPAPLLIIAGPAGSPPKISIPASKVPAVRPPPVVRPPFGVGVCPLPFPLPKPNNPANVLRIPPEPTLAPALTVVLTIFPPAAAYIAFHATCAALPKRLVKAFIG